MSDPNEFDSLDQSISALLPNAVEGDRDAQSELFSQLQSYFLIMARHQLDAELRPRVNPSDIVQESLAKATKALPEFRGSSEREVRAWLKRIVGNEIKEQRRKHRQQKRDVGRESKPDSYDQFRNEGHNLMAQSRTPQSKAMIEEELSYLRDNLSGLTPDHQQVIRLRSLERKSFAEIGELMDRSPEAIQKLWYRAILALRKKMSSE